MSDERMRAKMVELIRQGKKAFTKSDTTYMEEFLADYLIANSVIISQAAEEASR